MHSSKSQREIAADLGISQNAVGLIIRRFNETGESGTHRKGRCGRKQLLNNREKRVIIRECRKNPSISAGEVKTAVREIGEKVSISTIKKTLREGGLRVYRPLKMPYLDTRKRVSRRRWSSQFKDKPQEFWAQVYDFKKRQCANIPLPTCPWSISKAYYFFIYLGNLH
jgi:transposase